MYSWEALGDFAYAPLEMFWIYLFTVVIPNVQIVQQLSLEIHYMHFKCSH